MGAYFDEAFKEDELKDLIRHIFKCGLSAYKSALPMFDDPRYVIVDASNKKFDAAEEMFDILIDYHFPKLDETKSLGPVQDYIESKRKYANGCNATQNTPS